MKALSIIGLLLLVAVDARGQGEVALLPSAGPPDLARVLDEKLPAALDRGRSGQTIGADSLRQRLAGHPAVVQANEGALARVQRAEQLALNMEREPAIAEAREALSLLKEAGGALQAPALTARAQLALATALLLYPADQQAAWAACRAAIAADPEIAADEDRAPPRVIRLLARAREQPPAPSRVDEPLLGRVAELAAVDQLIWTRVGVPAGGSQLDLELQLYDRHSGRVRTILRKQLPRAALVEGTAALARQALGTARPIPTVAAAPASQPIRRVSGPFAPPWYARWWVWTAAGAVLAGTGLAVALALSGDDAPPPERLDLRFHLP
jgi:hypothetical protein